MQIQPGNTASASTPAERATGYAHSTTPTGYTRPWTDAECARVDAGGAVVEVATRSGEVGGIREVIAHLAVGVAVSVAFMGGGWLLFGGARRFFASLVG